MSSKEPDQPDIMRPPQAGRLGGIFATALIGVLGILMLAGAVMLLIGGQIAIAVILIAITAVMGILFRYVLRDARARQGWQIAIGADGLELDLPAGRSLIHQLAPVKAHVRFDGIEAVETRREAYRSLAMANMHRTYALKLKTGGLIILGEDRAQDTGMASNFLAGTVERIGAAGNIEIRDLGMVAGRGGILSVLFTSPAPWDAPGLDPGRQKALRRRAAWTGRLALLVAVLVAIAVLARRVL